MLGMTINSAIQRKILNALDKFTLNVSKLDMVTELMNPTIIKNDDMVMTIWWCLQWRRRWYWCLHDEGWKSRNDLMMLVPFLTSANDIRWIALRGIPGPEISDLKQEDN